MDEIQQLKKQIIEAMIREFESQAQILEQKFQEEIAAASDKQDSYSSFTPKELVEQKARLAISDLKTPLAELKNLAAKPIPAQTDSIIKNYSLFDLSIKTGTQTKVSTFFVLPIDSLGRVQLKVLVQDKKIFLTNNLHPWFGHQTNDRKNIKAHEIYKEPHPWAGPDPTGQWTQAQSIWVSKVY